MSNQDQIERGRKLITRLEVLQYEYFNGRPIWLTIKLDDLNLYMAYTYFGSPLENVLNEDIIDESSNDLFKYYSKECREQVSKMMTIIRKNYINHHTSEINVGFTLVHSICKQKCEICGNFPNEDIHQWYLLRIKLNTSKVVYIDLYHNRTYKNWHDYIENNNLPDGYMFYPESGFYEENKYLFQSITPISKLTTKILNSFDTMGRITSFSSCILFTGGLVFPIMSPVLIPASISIGTASLWDAGRQISKLKDMNIHNQSLISKEAMRHWFNLSISVLGAITAPLNAGIKSIEMGFSATFASKYGRTLSIFQKGTCITQCSLECARFLIKLKDKNYKITLTDFLTFRLDIFVVLGTLLPASYIHGLFTSLVDGVPFIQLYTGIKKIPYCLGHIILTSVYFIKDHLSQFCNKVYKFLCDEITPEKCLLAYKIICDKINHYRKQLPELNDKELLNHIVYNVITIPETQAEEVKKILCGESMQFLIDKLQANSNKNLIIFCIEQIREKASIISSKYDETLNELQLHYSEYDIVTVDAEFCKIYNLEKCCISDYLLHAINESINDFESILTSYHQHISRPENSFDEKLVISDTNGLQKLKIYEIPAPGDSLDSKSCVTFAQTIDPQNYAYNQYTYIQPETKVWILFSMLGLTFKVVFFRIDTYEGELMLNISFYENIHASVNRRLMA